MELAKKIFENIKSNGLNGVADRFNRQNRSYDQKQTENLQSHLKYYNKYLVDFLSFKMQSGLSEALKDSFCAWCSYMPTVEKYDFAKEILLEYNKDDGLKDYIEKIKNYISEIDEYNKDDFHTVKLLGYSNYILSIKKSFEKIKKLYNEMIQYTNVEYDVNKLTTVKGFINIECSECAAIKDIPKSLDNFGKADTELKNNNRKPFLFIRETCMMLKDAINDESTIRHLNELQQNFKEKERILNSEIEKATNLYKKLDSIVTDEWIETFNPSSKDESSVIVKISTNDELKQFYTDMMLPLVNIERKIEI